MLAQDSFGLETHAPVEPEGVPVAREDMQVDTPEPERPECVRQQESARLGREPFAARIRLADQYAVLRAPVLSIDVAEPDRANAPATRALHDHELVAVVARLHLGQPPEVLFHGRRPCAEQLRLHLRIGTHANDVGRVRPAHSSQQHALALDHFKSSSRISDSAPIARAAVRPMTRSSASGGSPKPSLPQRSTETLSRVSGSPGRMSRTAKMLRRAKARSSSSSGSVSLRPWPSVYSASRTR